MALPTKILIGLVSGVLTGIVANALGLDWLKQIPVSYTHLTLPTKA